MNNKKSPRGIRTRRCSPSPRGVNILWSLKRQAVVCVAKKTRPRPDSGVTTFMRIKNGCRVKRERGLKPFLKGESKSTRVSFIPPFFTTLERFIVIKEETKINSSVYIKIILLVMSVSDWGLLGWKSSVQFFFKFFPYILKKS